MKLQPLDAARQFVNEVFPACRGALLAGSIVRGEGTESSDLDIVVIDDGVEASYRESLVRFGWPIEMFVHNSVSYQTFVEEDRGRGRPSMANMLAEGIVLKDDGIMDKLKEEATTLLLQGPEPLTEEQIKVRRYFITDTLDDFIGSVKREEDLFIAATLAEQLHEFVLRINKQWTGQSKWIVRALKVYNPVFCEKFTEAFDIFYRQGDKEKIIVLTDEVLQPYGGRLFEGFSLGKGEQT
ncbi:nucleotidyltransferase domain-containing protein [Bacillus sp. 165]|uniref:nucleotidyltransferase domain-containing protein n=1 Tax=Bacillus sp. 165 TaxID=1529117 RepID=UPI001ADCCE7F|nr:nucleotidyltransferase domain-containing protein [Bacillus sp. 165]MBO9128422.1 nucleotidyltransferase domain-containing protein [Bacillus sp. 165]